VRGERTDLLAVAGLDQHDASNDRGTRVVLHQRTDDPMAELKAGRFTNRGLTLRFAARPTWGPLRLSALRACRLGLRIVERLHDSARARRRRRRPDQGAVR